MLDLKPVRRPRTDTDADEADYAIRPSTPARSRWKKHRDTNGALVDQRPAVGVAGIGPFACTGDTTEPGRSGEQRSLDTNGAAGQIVVATSAPALHRYRTIAPAGFSRIRIRRMRCDVTAGNDEGAFDTGRREGCLDVERLGNPVPGKDADEAEYSNAGFNARTISWEKRGHNRRTVSPTLRSP